jgi:hypothetical protein
MLDHNQFEILNARLKLKIVFHARRKKLWLNYIQPKNLIIIELYKAQNRPTDLEKDGHMFLC